MKKLLIFAALLILSPILSDAAEVRGHFLKDGTSVVPNPIVAPKEGRNTKVTEQPIEPDTIPGNIGIVGPSGEEIHNFLYPKLNDWKVVIPNQDGERAQNRILKHHTKIFSAALRQCGSWNKALHAEGIKVPKPPYVSRLAVLRALRELLNGHSQMTFHEHSDWPQFITWVA